MTRIFKSDTIPGSNLVCLTLAAMARLPSTVSLLFLHAKLSQLEKLYI